MRSSAKVRIKKIDPQKYVPSLKRMQKICLPADSPYPITTGDWWIAFVGAEFAGFACLAPSDTWRNCGYLARAGVMPKFRGKGIQKKLIKVRLRRAKRLGWETLFSDTLDNPPSSNSLIACGFRLFNPRVKWANKHSLYFRKKL